jgi:hypothetical protein
MYLSIVNDFTSNNLTRTNAADPENLKESESGPVYVSNQKVSNIILHTGKRTKSVPVVTRNSVLVDKVSRIKISKEMALRSST